MSTIAERVAAGAAFLDEHDPDWWRADAARAIDLGSLDLGEPEHCVLGQRCPLESPEHSAWWAQECALLGLPENVTVARVSHWSDDHGFSLGDPSCEHEYLWSDLTAEWKRVITERRARVPA